MTKVGGIGSGTPAPRRTARGAGGFALPGQPAARGPDAAAPASGLAALLALQEGDSGAEPPEARARRRAGLALDELRGLQIDLLRGAADPARLARLAALAEAAEGICDPALREALGGIALRVRLELARRRGPPLSG